MISLLFKDTIQLRLHFSLVAMGVRDLVVSGITGIYVIRLVPTAIFSLGPRWDLQACVQILESSVGRELFLLCDIEINWCGLVSLQ